MSSNTKTIYLDESGATGNHLMDPEQPFFVYASLGLEQDEASAIHSDWRRKGGPRRPKVVFLMEPRARGKGKSRLEDAQKRIDQGFRNFCGIWILH